MRITAISDIHGSLITIEPTDILIIAGDWSPLEIQRDFQEMKYWFEFKFIPWLKAIEAERIFFIAGNHDFLCDSSYWKQYFNVKFDFKRNFLPYILKKHNLEGKIFYLENSSAEYNGLIIYGCPYVEGCTGWAFSHAEYKKIYNQIPKCDILITHQPPDFDNVGTVVRYGKRYIFGSIQLLCTLTNIKPSYHFCGHIHEGDHSENILEYRDKSTTHIYNCAVKNEDYNLYFPNQIIDL